MTPQVFSQLTTQQKEKVISVTQARLDAKTKEVDALNTFRLHAPSVIAEFMPNAKSWPTSRNQALTMLEMDARVAELQNAAGQYLSAKHAQASMELEELQLTVTALKSWQSPIVGAHFR